MQANSMIRYILRQRNANAIYALASQANSAFVLRPFAVRFASTDDERTIGSTTTGWDKLQYPQQELLVIHRKAAKIEAPQLERRRRIHLFKIIIAIGATVVSLAIVLTFILLAIPYDNVTIGSGWI